MTIKAENKNQDSRKTGIKRYRDIDTATVEAEIKLIAVEIPNEVTVMRSLKAVSQDLLRLEFKV